MNDAVLACMIVETSLNSNSALSRGMGMFSDFPDNPEKEFRESRARVLRHLGLCQYIQPQELRVYGCEGVGRHDDDDDNDDDDDDGDEGGGRFYSDYEFSGYDNEEDKEQPEGEGGRENSRPQKETGREGEGRRDHIFAVPPPPAPRALPPFPPPPPRQPPQHHHQPGSNKVEVNERQEDEYY